MTVREYIGARYVPIFGRKDEESIIWDNSAPYEPLTIVLYQGNSYTSRQYVPAGVSIDNEEYWALTGNYNAQIEQYRSEVQAFDNRITANTGSISDLNIDLATEIQNRTTADTDLQTAIDNLETQIEESAKKRVAIYIGNSYTNGEGSTTGSDGLRALTAPYLFDENYRFTAGGAGFGTYSNHDTTFENLIDNAIASSQFDNETITDIIFISAMGDTRALAEGGSINNAIRDCCNKCRTNFPNAKIYIVYAEMVVGRTTQSSYSPRYWQYQLLVHQIFKTEALSKRFIYLGWIGWNGNNVTGYNAADGYHPNDAGYQLLAGAFLNAYAGITPYATKNAVVDGINVYANDPMSGRIYMPSTISNTLFPDGITSGTDYKLAEFVNDTTIASLVPLQTQNSLFQLLCVTSAGVVYPASVWLRVDTTTGNADLMIRFRQTIAAGSVPNMNSNRRLEYNASITSGLTIAIA